MAESELRIAPSGLFTALSPVQAPPGALLEAKNVCIRRPGTAEPRPGFSRVVAPETAGVIEGLIPFPRHDNTTDRYLATDGTETLWSTTDDPIQDEDGNDLLWESYAGVVSRQSLFILCEDALRGVHAINAATAYRAGAPIPALSSAASTAASDSGPAFSVDNTYRAYRAVLRRGANSNGQSHITRSAVSNRLVVLEDSAPDNMSITVALHQGDDFRAGDVIELYCTETSETYPGDEMYLTQEVELTSTHIGNGYVTILDDSRDNDLGRALYTNDSREGAESSHYRPPQAGCAAEFNNSLWLGDLAYPALMNLTFRGKSPNLGTGVAGTDEIGFRNVTGTRTNASAVVSSVSGADIAKVKVGMLTYHADWAGTGWVRVTAVASDNFTVDQNWAGATAAEAFSVYDSIRVGSEYHPAVHFVDSVRGNEARVTPIGLAPSSDYTADWGFDVPDVSGTYDFQIMQLSISCIMANTTPPEVWATNGHLYSPVLPEPSEVTGYTMPQDVLPDNVAWSNQDEPDHFRLDNVERVGRSGCTVLALVPSRNALLIFTDKGVWRASGFADSGISFAEVEPDARILGRLCAAELGGRVYMWGDSAVYDCDENECRDITTGIIDDLEEIADTIKTARSSPAKLVPNPKNDEILVLVPEDTNGPLTHAMVYNQLTGAWTKWVLSHSMLDMVIMPRSLRLRAAPEDLSSPVVLLERTRDAESADTADDDFGITVSAVDGTEVTIDSGSGWTPVVGDAIETDGDRFLVTAVTSSTVFDVHAEGVTAGEGVAYTAIDCDITPTVNTKKYPTGMKVWGEGTIWWNAYAGIHRYVLAFKSAITGSSAETTQTRTLASVLGSNLDKGSKASVSRFLTPRAAARGTHLTVALRIRQARSRWEYDGITVKNRLYGDRVKTRLG